MNRSQMQRGQVSAEAAETYDAMFVPALFQPWAPRVADAAGVNAGESVADIACGTGVLARELARRVGPAGSVVGIDNNPGMLAVARRQAPDIEWREARAEALPLPDASLHAVLSQFGLMFFDDRVAALDEMWRVLRPSGRLAIAVWDSLEHSPGYRLLARLLRELFGDDAAASLDAPFCLGDIQVLRGLLSASRIRDAHIATHAGEARYPSLEAWIVMNVKGWTLGGMLDDRQLERLLSRARQTLHGFVAGDGSVHVPTPAHIVTATRA